ncbi:uncharacterized protein BDR25DRAFT_106430 [Lindgomyces ingoldianus]|uniref:Uncharacterized protein n=1 Tax=Lindgomyces ingoldianus TaxID=673940 RepID=A0ACB6Q9N4_9PLEO|nr:uncharacterized protein BDR25DRAFT_106430 [Lindgomyces ingoldianus]KAF2463683.1 hypothetical protein BDR25DRAFT_106430 [Lindgomyces ingoldianus]
MGTLAKLPLYCSPLLLAYTANAAQNFVVPWSTKSYGPDGPWQAVKITVGGNDSTLTIGAQNHADLDVYPGGSWTTFTFAKEACDPYKNSICGAGGTWNPDPPSLKQIEWTDKYIDDSYGIQAASYTNVPRALTIASKTVWNASLGNIPYGNITYPNGKMGGMVLGHLALGAPDPEQVWSKSDKDAGQNITTNFFPSKLYMDNETPSNSYGLHIGSAAFDYPGSLQFGGYNKGRVIGPVTSFSGESIVDLLDIAIGVEFGSSPFGFDSKPGLLLNDSGQVGRMKVQVDPLTPYLSLPDNTCEGLANILPIKYDNTVKYYTWNTSDPKYKEIVTSPAYLSFTFPPAPGNKDNVVIKVPFALLNLTLDSPITAKPTQYFPCNPYHGNIPRLGRAFLQAAFIGRNWGTKTTWLAQAPGPGISNSGLGDSNTAIANDQTMIEGFTGDDLFKQSWDGHWSILNSTKPNSTAPSGGAGETNKPTASPPPASGLSTGAKVGIGVAVPVGVLALIGAFIFIWRRRAHKKNTIYPALVDQLPTHEMDSGSDSQARYSDQAPQKYAAVDQTPQELHVETHALEMPDRNDPRMT